MAQVTNPGAGCGKHVPLTAWLRAEGLWVAAGSAPPDGAPLTHVFLDGGKASVPPARAREFLDQYARALVAGEALYAVERVHGGSYRMFADFDVPLDLMVGASPENQGESLEEPGAWLRSVVREALASAPPQLSKGAVVVCCRSAAAGKTGAHLVWQDLYVDDDAAMALRDLWVEGCARAAPHFPWDSVIDAAVYRRNGLRMPWSLKRGGTAEAAYVPSMVYEYSQEGVLRPEPQLAPDPMPASQVRAWLERATLDAGGGRAIDPDVAELSRGSGRQPRLGQGGGGGGAAAVACPDLSRSQLDALRDLLPAPYKKCVVERVRRAHGGDGVLLYTDCRFCLHAGREHSSNRAYFVAWRSGGIFQCCFSDSKGDGGLPCHQVRTKVADRHALPDELFGRRGGDGAPEANTSQHKFPVLLVAPKQQPPKRQRTEAPRGGRGSGGGGGRGRGGGREGGRGRGRGRGRAGLSKRAAVLPRSAASAAGAWLGRVLG